MPQPFLCVGHLGLVAHSPVRRAWCLKVYEKESAGVPLNDLFLWCFYVSVGFCAHAVVREGVKNKETMCFDLPGGVHCVIFDFRVGFVTGIGPGPPADDAAFAVEVETTFFKSQRKIIGRRGDGGEVCWDIAPRSGPGCGRGVQRAGEDRGKGGGEQEDTFEHFFSKRVFLCGRGRLLTSQIEEGVALPIYSSHTGFLEL